MKRIFTAAIVTTAISVSSGCDNAGQRLEKYVAQGDSYLQQKNVDKARISYKNALQIDPENTDARLKYADVLERSDDLKGAYGMYLAVLEKEPQHIRALERQGRILMLARESAKAMENAEQLLTLKGADYVPGLALKAGVLSTEGKVGDAVALAERAVKLDGTHLDSSILLGSLYMRQASFAQAEVTFRTAISAHPDVTGLRIMLAESLKKQGRTEDVEVVLRELARSEPDVLAHVMELSRHLHQRGRAEEALKFMSDYVEEHEDDVDAKLAYVQLVDVARDVEQSDRILTQFIAASPEKYQLQFARIERQLARGQRDEAVQALDAIVALKKTGGDAVTARVMLARLHLADNNIDRAKTLLDEVLTLNPGDIDALAVRGRIAASEKRYVDAIGDLRTVVKERAGDLDSLMLLAGAHMANEEIDLADELLFRAVKLNPPHRKLRLLLAEVKARKGDADAAIEQYRAVLDKYPDDETALLALARLYQSGNDGAGLAVVADQMLGSKNTMAAGFFYQGLLRQGEGQHEQARELFEKSLTLSEGAVEPSTALVKTYLAQNQPLSAVSWLDARLAKKPDNATLHNLRAEALLVAKKYDDAATSLRKAIELSPAWWVPYRSLATIEIGRKDFAAAQKTLEQGIAATNNNPMLRMELAVFFDRAGKIDDAIVVYRAMIDDGLIGDSVINNFAMLLATKADQQSLETARVYSERLARSKNPLYLDTAGWVHYKRGDYQSALPILEKAVEMAPQHPQIRYHLGVAYYRNNQHEKAKQHLVQALKDEINFDGRKDAEQVLQQLNKG